MKRRDFLKFLGIGGIGASAGFVLGKVSKQPGAKLIPRLIPPEDVIPGIANWYSSLCTQCSAGCGILVRVMEGRAKKIEGNPAHPVNKGGLCARGQASLQALYNPDRIKRPLKRRGDRGKADFIEISWDEALSTLANNISELTKKGEGDKLYLLTSTLRGHLNNLINSFLSGAGSSNHVQYELFQNRNLLYASQVSLGVNSIPHYNIANTRYLLSFGADFSSTWLSPVNLSRGYGNMRQGEPGKRGKLVQIEPRMSLTGANADEWVPAKPGTEALVALAIANVIVEKGYYRGPDASAWRSVLHKFNPKDIASTADVSVEKIEHMAKEFMANRPALAIGGDVLSAYENGTSGLVAVNVLNHLAGAVGAKGGVIPNADDFKVGYRADLNKKITGLVDAASMGKVKTLLIYNTNPVFTTPRALNTAEALNKIPFIASFSSFMDETTAYADLVLPAHTGIEDWGDDFPEPGVALSVATIQQPAVAPVYDTKGLGDIMLALAKKAGGSLSTRFSTESFAEYLKGSWKELYSRNREMAAGALGFEDFWNKALQNGGWFGGERKRSASVSTRVAEHLTDKPARFEGEDYPYYLIPYAHAGHLDGRGANLPWLQEMADPMTSVVWGTWVEINPSTASSIGVKEGDWVTIESPKGKIIAPVYVYPAIRPDTVAVPIGQGHSLYGRYAKDRGSNPIEILPVKENPRTGEIALNSTKVKIYRTNAPERMVKIEGSTKELKRNIVQTVSIEEYRKMGKEA